MAENPFSHPSRLPYQMPPFDRVSNADYRSGFAEGLCLLCVEVSRIVDSPAHADFVFTVVALERSGLMLNRVSSVFFNLNASNTEAEMDAIESEVAPKLQAHEDAIYLDPALFARVDAVYQRRAGLNLDPESLQLLNRYYIEFVRAGARLGAADKARLRDINGELSSLTTQFKQNVLKATTSGAVIVDDVAQLDGLSALQVGAAAAAAQARGQTGKWVITLQNTTNQPPLL